VAALEKAPCVIRWQRLDFDLSKLVQKAPLKESNKTPNTIKVGFFRSLRSLGCSALRVCSRMPTALLRYQPFHAERRLPRSYEAICLNSTKPNKIILNFRKISLRRILKKPFPDRYTVSLPENQQKSYDFLSARGSTSEHADAYIKSWDEHRDVVSYLWWPKGTKDGKGTEAECSFTDLKWETLNVDQRYRTWDIRYTSVTKAYFHDLLRIPWCKWWIQKLRNRFVVPVKPDDSIQLLIRIVDLHSHQASITTDGLLEDIHGSAIRLSSDRHRHLQNLKFLLDSLNESEDIVFRDENKNANNFVGDRPIFFGGGQIGPTPRSASTIAEYNEQVARHRDVVTLAKRQLWLGWAMFSIAFATFFVELRKYFE
jgi:hypothetical protein